MKAEFVLEMLREKDLETLTRVAKEELITKEKAKCKGEKERYKSMQRFYKYVEDQRGFMTKPYRMEDGRYSFLSPYCHVLTTEDTGSMELFQTNDKYFDVPSLYKGYNENETYDFDFGKILSELKIEGYKLKKKMDRNFYIKMGEKYINFRLIDLVLGILDNGKPFTMYFKNNRTTALYFENEIGIALVLPVHYQKAQADTDYIYEIGY